MVIEGDRISEAIWQQLEIGSFRGDIPLWLEIASRRSVPILELGSGTGRVALQLARAGHRVVALECEQDLCDHLERESTRSNLPVSVVRGAFPEPVAIADLPGLLIAPMQFANLFSPQTFADGIAHLVGHSGDRPHLVLAVLDDRRLVEGEHLLAGLPDMVDLDGRLLSSRVTKLRTDRERISLHRLREIVESDGTRHTAHLETTLWRHRRHSLEEVLSRLGYRFEEGMSLEGEGGMAPSEVMVFVPEETIRR